MSPDEQGLGVVNRPRGLGCTAVPTDDGNAIALESKVVRDLFRQSKILPPGRSDATPLQKTMARDLLGFDTLPPSAITYHAMLSSLDKEGGLNLVECTWPAGTHIPCHVHHCEDEIFIVLSGTVELRVAERTFRCGAGERAFTPRGTQHEVRALTETRHIAILTRGPVMG